jgi:hypothetical protein
MLLLFYVEFVKALVMLSAGHVMNLYMKAFGEATLDSAPVYFWGCK